MSEWAAYRRDRADADWRNSVARPNAPSWGPGYVILPSAELAPSVATEDGKLQIRLRHPDGTERYMLVSPEQLRSGDLFCRDCLSPQPVDYELLCETCAELARMRAAEARSARQRRQARPAVLAARSAWLVSLIGLIAAILLARFWPQFALAWAVTALAMLLGKTRPWRDTRMDGRRVK